MKKMRKTIYALFPLLLFLLLAEVALRVAGFNYDSYFAQAFWWKRFSNNPIYERDPVRFWRLRPYANSDLNPESRDTQLINGMGFRDDEFPEQKSPGELRVITMGDSCTFGDGVANWETFSNVLEDMLSEAQPGRKVQVINGGVPGYTSYQIYQYLKNDLLPFQPDLVVLYVGFNDNVPGVNGITDAERGSVNSSVWEVQKNFNSWRSYQFLKYALLRLKTRIFPGVNPEENSGNGVEHQIFRVPFDDFVDNLIRIHELGRQQGFQVLMFTLPHEFPYEPERNGFIRRAARKGNVPMIDLYKIFKQYQAAGEDLYTPDGGHPNVLGHQRIAEILFDKMSSMEMTNSK